MSVLPVGIAASGDEGYTLDNSLRFRSSASAYLSRTPSSASNQKTWTWSAWVKRGKIGSGAYTLFSAGNSNSNFGGIYFNYSSTTDDIEFLDYPGASSTWLKTNALYRDVSSWYHVVVAYDTTQATSSDRAKLYVNGEQVTSFASAAYPTQNSDSRFNSTLLHTVGAQSAAAVSAYFDGYMTEINFIDGQQLTADDFGETDATTGVWKPKAYSGTYGTNGFYLPTTATTQADGFNTVLYTGNGASQSIGDVGFSPDLVWIKARNYASGHALFDTIRGPLQYLGSEATTAEFTLANSLTSFDSDGFSLSTQTGVNRSGYEFVAWCWDAGSGSPASNTQGTIPSTVKANTTQGFSIVSYIGNETAGATVGHGLTSAPEMVIVKNRDSAYNWTVYHKDLTSAEYVLVLNSTAAEASSSVQFNSTAPSSSVITLGWGGSANNTNTAQDHIAYCFHSVAGYSKFDSYTGTGSSGNTVTTGFRPAFLMIKSTDATATGWIMVDNTRDPDNLASEYLYADSSAAEATYTNILEFTDTGFELIIGAGSAVNQSGVNYIYMAFADTRDAQFNFDASGNKNNWTPNNINSNASSETSYDIMTDVPTLTDEYTANYATLNPLQDTGTLSNGNLKFTGASTYSGRKATMAIPSTGKWYWENLVQNQNTAAGSWVIVGMCTNSLSLAAYSQTNADSVAYGDRNDNRAITNGTSIVTQNSAIDFSTGDVLQCAYDADTGKFWFGRNNTWFDSSAGSTGDPTNGTNQTLTAADKEWFPYVQANLTSNVIDINFGQRPFKYTPPTGFLPLNTYNLPDATIEDGSKQFNTVLYSGDGTNDRAITGVGFQPDFTWLKARNDVADHTLFDAVRGAGSNKALYSNTNVAEGTYTAGFDAFLSDGFQVDNNVYTNSSSNTYAAWNWKANGSGSSNTDGSITSTVSANTTSGFSVVTYTGSPGDTVGHGLGVAPKMIIQKDRDNSVLWRVFHYLMSGSEDYNPTDNLHLNTTNAYPPGVGAATRINGVNATTFTNTGGYTASDQLAYCFASVEGFSAFGSYTGNGSTNGPFIYTGFRPAFVIYKNTTASGTSWMMYDSSRNLYNSVDAALYAESTSAETSYYDLDFLSNGFKIRTTTTNLNGSGATYIYAAFAENPFKNSLAR